MDIWIIYFNEFRCTFHTHTYTHIHTHQSVCPSVRPSVRPPVRPSVRPYVRPSVRPLIIPRLVFCCFKTLLRLRFLVLRPWRFFFSLLEKVSCTTTKYISVGNAGKTSSLSLGRNWLSRLLIFCLNYSAQPSWW